MRNASPARDSSRTAVEPGRDDLPGLGLGLGRLAYGIYSWAQFLLVGLLTLALLLILPTQRARRALTRTSARLVLALAGMRVHAPGPASLPQPCVVVANHASYLDGVVLNAVLPIGFSFVIKREMSSVPLAGLLLRRLGAEFVDRRGRAHGISDARRLLRRAISGQALVFFPEGTFGPASGLLHFHIGAFAAAARANLPVVPLAIRGTRHCLSPASYWPRPGRIEVQQLSPLPALPTGPEDGDRAAALRDQARAALLAALGEPDLTGT
jgi:1-acyl-sn-glycerol-3-phosphate acyltransferase